jgi:hypothetical protein
VFVIFFRLHRHAYLILSGDLSISFDAVSAVKINMTVKMVKSLYMPGRRIRGVGLQIHSLLTSALDGGALSASLLRPVFLCGRPSGDQLNKGLGGTV